MGVTDLWSVLDPIKEHLPLSILGGQKLAVDLSIWICEAQGSKQLEATINKPFLRNLFFRVNHLLHLGIDLVFVIDGRAPEIKAGTIHRRQNERFLYGKSIRNNFHQPKTTKRSNLNAAVKECCELLDCLGVPYVESHGEAEAYCAFLNKNGLVDACLTNDGDAFLYGAKKVYRNFTMDRKDPHVESYNMQHIQQHLQFNQERLVAFALLTGCDYQPKGVPHVGVETALKLLRSLVNIDILSRFRQWKTMELSECFCGIEKSVKEKASKLPEFPSEQIIQEFLVSKDVLPKKNLQWKSPNMKKFENFVVAKMDWEKGYAVQRVLPLVTRWIMLEKLGLVNTKPYGLHLTPVKILKNRVCKGVASVEVEWNVSGSTDPEPYVTVEDKEMVSQSFPDLMEQFLQDLQNSAKAKAASKVKSKKGNRSQKPNADPDPNQQVLLLSMKGLSLTANKPAGQTSVEGVRVEGFVESVGTTTTTSSATTTTSYAVLAATSTRPPSPPPPATRTRTKDTIATAATVASSTTVATRTTTTTVASKLTATGSTTCGLYSTDSQKDESSRNCYSSVYRPQSWPHSSSDVDVSNTVGTTSFAQDDSNDDDDELYVPLKERIKKSHVQKQSKKSTTNSNNNNNNKVITKVTTSSSSSLSSLHSLTPPSSLHSRASSSYSLASSSSLSSSTLSSPSSFTNSKKSVHSTTIHPKHTNQTLSRHDVSSHSSNNPTNSITECTKEPIGLLQHSVIEIDSSSDEDSDDSLFLPVSHKLQDRYNISIDSDNESTFFPTQCSILPSSDQGPTSRNMIAKVDPGTGKLETLETLETQESLDVSEQKIESCGDVPLERFAGDVSNCDKLSKEQEIMKEFLSLNIKDGTQESLTRPPRPQLTSTEVSLSQTSQPPLPPTEVSLTSQPPLPSTEISQTSQPPLPSTEVLLLQPPRPSTKISLLLSQPPLPSTEVSLSLSWPPQPPTEVSVSQTSQPPLSSTEISHTSQPPLPSTEISHTSQPELPLLSSYPGGHVIHDNQNRQDTSQIYPGIGRSFSTDITQLCNDMVQGSFSTDATQLCNDTLRGSFSTDHTQLCNDTVLGSFSTNVTQLCSDPVEGSFSADVTLLCTDPLVRSFGTDTTQLCSETVVKPPPSSSSSSSSSATVQRSFSTNSTQLCADTAESSFFTNPTQVCTDTVERSFSAASTQPCHNTTESSFFTNTTQLCTDTVERSFSTVATQLCNDTVQGSFSTDATQVCNDTVQGSFSTNSAQLCTETTESSFFTDPTQLCNDTVERSFSTTSTQPCHDSAESSFFTNATQLCTDTVERSFSTAATQLCPAEEDSPTTYVRAPRSNVLTSYLPNTAAPQVYPDPSKFIPLADTPRSLCVCQAMPQTIQHNQNHLASTTEPYPGISDSFFQMSFNGTVQDASCIYTNVNDSINGVSNDDTLLSPSLISERKLLSKDSDICAHTQHDNSSLLVIHNNSAVSIKSKSLPLSSGSGKNQSVCNSSLKDSGSIFIDDANNNGNNNDTEFNFVDGKNNAEILDNCCVISKDSLNTTKCKSNIPENVLSSDFGNLDQTQSESGLCKYIAATAAAGTTVGEFHVEDTPEKGISICNTDPSEESIPFSSFEDNSLIMNLSSNMTPKSFQSFNESRAGNFELISSLLDNSSGVDFDSTKTSDDSILKRCLINSTVKKHMKLNNLDRNKSLDSSKTKPFLNLSPYSRSIKRISTPVESPNYGNYSSSPSDVSAIEKSSLTSVPPEKLSPNSQKINTSGFYSDDEGIIDISTYRITPDRYSQTPPQQRNSSHLKGGGYLHSFEDSFSPFADSNILTPEPVNQSQLLKHYQDDIGSSPGTVVDTGSTNMKTGTGVHEDSCHEDFSKDLKPPPESPLPLIMRLGKHFNSQRIKNLKK